MADYMSQVDVAPPGSNVEPVYVLCLKQSALCAKKILSSALKAWGEDGKDFQTLLVS